MGQDEIIRSCQNSDKMVRWGGWDLFVTISYATFGSILMAKKWMFVKMPGNVTEKSIKCHKKLFENHLKDKKCHFFS